MNALALAVIAFALVALPTYGAVPGTAANGVTDDTAALQSAIDKLPRYGVLDGGGSLYLTGTLRLKSQMTLQNFRFKTRPSSTPGTVPVTLDGTVNPVSEVRITNVSVDGNRSAQTNLRTVEDGARDCFRIAGVARDIWILNSSAVNCATDGLKIFSADTRPPAGSLNFSNIYVVNSTFNNNRRHGMSIDSIRNVQLISVRMNGNGLPVGVAGRTPTEGESAYLVDGMLYGAGLVVEGYTAEGTVDGLNVIACTATGNARFGIQFWEASLSTAAGFSPRANIRIESSTLDGGVSPTHGRQAIEFNVPAASLGYGFVYRNVTLSDNRIDGTAIVNATSGFRIVGGVVNSPYAGFYAISRASRDVVAQGVSSGGKLFVQQ